MQRIRRTETEDEDENDLEFDLNYENKLPGDENHKLTALAKFDISDETGSSTFRERVTQGSANADRQRSTNEESWKRGVLRVDYEYPHSEKLKFEAGMRSNYRDINENNTIYEWQNGDWVNITGNTENIGGNFTYQQNVNAAYGIVGYQPGNWSFQFGLRAEQTNVETSHLASDQTTTQSYTNVFPSVHASYDLTQKQSILASYSRRLSRPDAWSLIPFSSFSDTRSRWIGNPDLDPIFTDSYEMGYQRYWEGGNALASVYYRHEEGVIERITYQQNGITFTRPINMATSDNWGVELSIEQEIFQDFELRGSMNMYRSNTSGSYESEARTRELEASSSRLYGRLRAQWQFLDGWNYQASMRYSGPHETTQGREFSSGEVDMGLSTELWDGKGRISMRVRDLLDSEKHHSITNEENLYVENVFRWSQRSFSIDFTYYFNKDFESDDRRGRGYR
jgi:outer membrane receptor protein involved in Fe transport